jgi:hypothetical protein
MERHISSNPLPKSNNAHASTFKLASSSGLKTLGTTRGMPEASNKGDFR